MRLSNGFVIDKEKTFGELKFTAVRDVFLQNEDRDTEYPAKAYL